MTYKGVGITLTRVTVIKLQPIITAIDSIFRFKMTLLKCHFQLTLQKSHDDSYIISSVAKYIKL